MTPQEEFKKMRDITCITQWHDAGYRGKGAKVFNSESMSTPHGSGTGSIIQAICPEAEFLHGSVNRNIKQDHLISFNVVPDGRDEKPIEYEEYIKLNHIKLISSSERGKTTCRQYLDLMTRLVKEQDLIINNCAYNDGLGDGETIDTFYPAELVNTIGALNCNLNNPKRAIYSSVGKEMDFCQFAPLISGTSAATPFISGMCALIIGRYGFMSRQEMFQFLKFCAKDLGEYGLDTWYGWGHIILPPVTKKYITMEIGSASYKVDGKSKTMDTAPINKEGNTFVPLRIISESLGYQITPFTNVDKTIKVTVNKENTSVVLITESNVMQINGRKQFLNFAPYIDGNNRTLVPLRAIAEAFKCKVDWIQKEKKVMILEN